jgi:hypothetical protein
MLFMAEIKPVAAPTNINPATMIITRITAAPLVHDQQALRRSCTSCERPSINNLFKRGSNIVMAATTSASFPSNGEDSSPALIRFLFIAAISLFDGISHNQSSV